MKTLVYINGLMVPEEKATISVFDRGFNYGDGLFETMKACGGRPTFVKEHLERLKTGARLIGLPKNLKGFEKEIKAGLLERLLEANGLSEGEAYIRITVTRGVDRGGHGPSPGLSPTIVVTAKPLDAEMIEGHRRNGVRAITLKGLCPSLPLIKSLNYLPNVLGKMEAGRRGAFEGIFVENDSTIKEGTSTNVFIVKDGVIKTPPLSGGVLPGITRGVILRVARAEKVPAKETAITVKDLETCDEAFLTNSIIEVVPLVKVNSKPLGDGRPGGITRQVQKGYGELKTDFTPSSQPSQISPRAASARLSKVRRS